MPLVLFDRACSPHSALRITAVKTAADVAKPAFSSRRYANAGWKSQSAKADFASLAVTLVADYFEVRNVGYYNH
jgi:hypothetical protein